MNLYQKRPKPFSTRLAIPPKIATSKYHKGYCTRCSNQATTEALFRDGGAIVVESYLHGCMMLLFGIIKKGLLHQNIMKAAVFVVVMKLYSMSG